MNLTEIDLQLEHKGWAIIPKVITESSRVRIKNEMIRQTLNVTLLKQGVTIDPLDPKNLQLLVDPKLRKESLADPNIIWRNGNSRDPIVSKSTGMTPYHYNPIVLEEIAFSPILYQIMSELYRTNQLIHSEGPELFSIKPPGSTPMCQHIDANPFYPEVNYPRRIQSLVCIEMDQLDPPEKAGTLQVLENFHYYFKLFGLLFHPVGGLYRFPNNNRRFFTLPENFDQVWLPLINKVIAEYTQYQYLQYQNRFQSQSQSQSPSQSQSLSFDLSSGVSSTILSENPAKSHLCSPPEKILNSDLSGLHPNILEAYRICFYQLGLRVPLTALSIKWVPIPVKPGDMIVWNQYLPHFSSANRSAIPRMVCYYSVFPLEKIEWYNSSAHQKLVKMWWNKTYQYSASSLYISSKKLDNPEEAAEFSKLSESEKKKYRDWLTLDIFRGQITGLFPYEN